MPFTVQVAIRPNREELQDLKSLALWEILMEITDSVISVKTVVNVYFNVLMMLEFQRKAVSSNVMANVEGEHQFEC